MDWSDEINWTGMKDNKSLGTELEKVTLQKLFCCQGSSLEPVFTMYHSYKTQNTNMLKQVVIPDYILALKYSYSMLEGTQKRHLSISKYEKREEKELSPL